jgi:integrase
MLSDKAIQALRPDPERPGTKHHDRDGLYLWVARSGSKTWRKDYRWQGARRTFTIGAYPAVRLADARKQALELNTWIKAGVDPRTQAPTQQRKQAESSSRPFVQIAQAWFEHHSTSWSPRHRRDMREKLDHFVIPALGQLDIEGISRSDIETRLLAPILARGANEQARRCNDVARRVIEHAVDLELRQDNPAVKARKVIAATRVTHYHRISWVELPELLTVIDRFERQRLAERSSLIALRLMMLTLVRPSELREARWSEVDTQAGQWIIPAERMKTRVRHIVPLSSQARLLFDLQRPITGHTCKPSANLKPLCAGPADDREPAVAREAGPLPAARPGHRRQHGGGGGAAAQRLDWRHQRWGGLAGVPAGGAAAAAPQPRS